MANQWGNRARRHYREYLPGQYLAIPDKETFFRELGHTAATQIETVHRQLARSCGSTTKVRRTLMFCFLISTGTAITKAFQRAKIAQLFTQEEADVALLYFSGHDTENNLGGYLVTPDAASSDEG